MGRRTPVLDLLWYVGMSVFLLAFLSPIIWVYLASLTPSDQLAASPTAIFDVRHWTLDAFGSVWQGFAFSRAFLNTCVVSAAVALCTTFLCSLPAYALSRFTFRGKSSMAMLILLGQLLPGIVVLVPIILLLRTVHLTDNLVGLALVYTISGVPVAVWLMRGFLNAIPRELDESVLVDGGHTFDVLRFVILPLALPGVITVATLSFIGSWGEYLFALSLITSDQNWTLPLALQEAFSQNTVSLSALTAGGVIASLPVSLMFMVAQRSLVGGLTAGSVKG